MKKLELQQSSLKTYTSTLYNLFLGEIPIPRLSIQTVFDCF